MVQIKVWARQNKLTLIYLVISILLPLIWWRPGYLYTGEEYSFVNFQLIFDKFQYAWIDRDDAGRPIEPEYHSTTIPNAAFYKASEALGLANHQIQRLFLQIYLLGLLLAISYFLRLFTDKESVLLLGSLFYLSGFYIIGFLFYSAKMYQLILIPWLFALTYRYFVTRDYKYAILNFFAFFVLQGVFINLPQLISTVITYPLALCYLYVTQKAVYTKTLLKQILLFFLPLLPLVLYHFVVYYYSYLSVSDALNESLLFSYFKAPVVKILQLRGSWWEGQSYAGVPYNTWFDFYNSPVSLLASGVLIIMAFLPMSKKAVGVQYLFFLVLLFVAVLLASGFSPFPGFYEYLHEQFFIFRFFREPWAKFIPWVAFCLVTMLTVFLHAAKEKAILLIACTAIAIKLVPFVSPDFFDYSNRGWKKLFMKPPAYWQEYVAWADARPDAYVLAIPAQIPNAAFLYYWYEQDLGNTSMPVPEAFGKANLFGSIRRRFTNWRFHTLWNEFGDSKAVDIVKIGTVDYLLEQRDFMNVAGADTSYQNTIKKYFEEVPVESFGDRLFIYRLRSEYQVPKVFLPKRLYFAQLDPASVVERVSATEFKPQEVIIAADNQHWQGLEVTSPESKISFKKINPTKYVVKLEGTAKQAPLVLTESYNDNWKLHEITQSMYEKPAIFDTWPIFTWRGVREIAGNTHTVVNGYANGWVVSKGTKTASASVYLAIEYTPQHFFYVLRFLNFSLAVCLLIFYFTVPYKNKWRK